jgi:hypothetical protein
MIDKDAKCTIPMHDLLPDMHGGSGARVVTAWCPHCKTGQNEVMCDKFWEHMMNNLDWLVPCSECGKSTPVFRAITSGRVLR